MLARTLVVEILVRFLVVEMLVRSLVVEMLVRSYPAKLKLCMVVKYIHKFTHVMPFWTVKGDHYIFSLDKNFGICF